MPDNFEYEFDVFISFTGSDRDLKNNIATRLDAAGYNVYDSDKICKGYFREDYVKALHRSRVYLLILSDSLRNNPAVSGQGSFSECRKELSTALELDSFNRLNIVTLCISDYFKFRDGLYDFNDQISSFYYSNTRGLTMVFDYPEENGIISDKAYHDIETRIHSFITERNNGTPVPSQTPKYKITVEKLPCAEVFVGRENEMTDAVKSFENGCNVVILSGMGGIGKTVLATRIAGLCNEQSYLKYMQTVRIPELSDGSGLLNSLVSFAGYTPELYDSLARLNERDQHEMKFRALSELPDYSLLVIDNYNSLCEKDLVDITDRLNCRILITTRSHISSCSNKISTINVKEMNRRQAFELFVSYCPSITDTDFDRLYEYTGGHTQTLCIIAKMMTLHKMSADEMLDRLNCGSSAAKVEFWHNDYSLSGTITDHLTKLFDISGFDEAHLNLLRQMTLLSDGRIPTGEFMKALGLETRNEIIALSRAGWIETVTNDNEESLYIHPIISHLMAELLLPDDINCAKMIGYLIAKTKSKKQAMTYSDARILCEKLYYALHTLACSCKKINHTLFDIFSEINNILGGEDAKKRLSDLLKITTAESDTALVSAYYDTLLIYENPSRLDVFDKYIENIEKNANNYKWVLSTLSVVLPYVQLNDSYKKKLAHIIDIAADAAIYRKDHLALATLLTALLNLDGEAISTVKKIHRYVKTIKKSQNDGETLILRISDAQIVNSGILRYSDAGVALEKNMRMIEDMTEISGFFDILGFLIKYPWLAVSALKTGSSIYKISEFDPMKRFFDIVLDTSESMVENGAINMKNIIYALVELNKNLTERGFSLQSAEHSVMNALAAFSNLNIPKETALGEVEMITEGIDMENPSLMQISTLQVSAIINSQFGDGEKALAQRRAIMDTLGRVRPKGHMDVVNASVSYGDTCLNFGKYEEAITLYTKLHSEFQEKPDKSSVLSLISRKLLNSTQRFVWQSKNPAEITKKISVDVLKKHFSEGTSDLSTSDFEYYKTLYDYTVILAAKLAFEEEFSPDYRDAASALDGIYGIVADRAKNHKQYTASILNQLIYTAESSLYYVRVKDFSRARSVAESLRPLIAHKNISVKNNAKRAYITTMGYVNLKAASDVDARLALQLELISKYIEIGNTLRNSSSALGEMFNMLSHENEILTDRKRFVSVFTSKKACQSKIEAMLDEISREIVITADYYDSDKLDRMFNFVTNKTFALIAGIFKGHSFGVTDKKYRKMKHASDFILAAFASIRDEIKARPWLEDEGRFNNIESTCYYFYEGESAPDGKADGNGTLYQAATGKIKYEGQWKAGKFHGFGKFYYNDGRVYEGEWLEDKRWGFGKLTYSDGGFYEGEWQNNLRHGKGTHTYSTGGVDSGEWRDGKLNGNGSAVYPDGCHYEGEFKNGFRHGTGKYTYESGNYYVGEWQNGYRHGNGKFVFIEGGYYEGEWEGGNRHGKGKCLYKDGDFYEGEWETDKPHGQGVYKYNNGTVDEGNWFKGKLSGFGRRTFEDGTFYEGEFMKGNYHGKGICTYPDGKILDGNWMFGKMSGQARCSYPSGATYEGNMLNGEFSGEGKYTYPSGGYYEGNWLSGTYFGKGKIVFPEGTIYIGEFKNSKLSGFCNLYYPDGEVYEGEFDEHNPVGEGKLTFPDGGFCIGEFTKTDGRLYSQSVIYTAKDGSQATGRVENNLFIPNE